MVTRITFFVAVLHAVHIAVYAQQQVVKSMSLLFRDEDGTLHTVRRTVGFLALRIPAKQMALILGRKQDGIL